jgi:O-acetyl-ADP-ribose deacetylase (regulator of RNase III)
MRPTYNANMDQTVIRGTLLRLVQGDITKAPVDAIVNAANSQLAGGGGVDGAIHRAGGPQVLAGCRAWHDAHGDLPAGECMVTTGGHLPARAVIHTVGPVWRGGAHDEPAKLASCYRKSLLAALAQGHRTVAFPSISTGVYGYPMDAAAEVALTALQQTLVHDVESGMFREIQVVLFDEVALAAWRRALSRLVFGEDGP